MNMYVGGVNITIYDRINTELENYTLNDKENIIYNVRFMDLENEEIKEMLMTKDSIIDYLKSLMSECFFISDLYLLLSKEVKNFKKKKVRI